MRFLGVRRTWGLKTDAGGRNLECLQLRRLRSRLFSAAELDVEGAVAAVPDMGWRVPYNNGSQFWFGEP